MKKAIGCIGQGFVGGSLTTVFSEHGLTVYVHDKTGKVAPGGLDPKFVERPTNDFSRIVQNPCKTISEFVHACEEKKEFSGVYFVCVPTPMRPDGSADLSIVESVLKELSSVGGSRIAVVKSTVPPGTTARWNSEYSKSSNSGRLTVVFCPEFLTEANALDDMRNQTRIILGGPRPEINTVKQIFQSAFPKVPLVKTSSTTAEMVKYTTNCFLATKVSFANEIAQICEALDSKGMNIDYDKVVEYSKLDKRLGDSHWAVPGPVPTQEGKYVRGYGGHCVIAGTYVTLANGEKIKVENLEIRDLILSTDHKVDQLTMKSINEITTTDYNDQVFEFTVETKKGWNTLICTPEHILPIIRNGKLLLELAKNITLEDELFIDDN